MLPVERHTGESLTRALTRYGGEDEQKMSSGVRIMLGIMLASGSQWLRSPPEGRITLIHKNPG